MYLLILAIVILFLSSLQSAYYVECLKKPRYERPPLFMKREMLLIYSNIMFLVAGFIMLFIAVGWWGFAGIAIYWFLVVFFLLPIGMQRLLLLILREKQSTLPHGDIEETYLVHDLDRLEQKSEQIADNEEDEDEDEDKTPLLKALSIEDLLIMKEKYKEISSAVRLINGVLEKRSSKKFRAKILVVDDDEWYLEFVSNQLIAEGYKIDTSVDGIDTLAKIKENKYNILLIGTRMPMRGFELYKQVCRIDPQLANKTIVISSRSGSVNDEDTGEFLAENKLPYIAKPFSTEHLINEVNRVLTLRG